MASGENKWEVVGNVKVKTKNDKQAVKDKMLKAEDLPLNKIQSMMFQGANGKPLKDSSNTVAPNQGTKTVKPAKKRPKKAVELKYKYMTLKEGLNGEEILSLETVYSKLKESFPNSQLLWRKEISSYINLHLACPEDSLSVSGKEKEFPFSQAKKSTRQILLNIFGDLNDEMVPLVFNHCIYSMLDCASKDIPVWGYRLCIQSLTFFHPNLCSQNMEGFVDKINSMHNVPKRCLLLLWALGQCGRKDIKCGFKVWLTVMLPTLHIKNIASYSMSYIESITAQLNGNTVKLLSGVMDVDEFYEVAKLSFNDNLTSTLKTVGQRMKDIYPHFEQLQLNKNSNKRILFEKLMTTEWEKSEIFENKMRDLCLECITSDQHCFNIWRSVYVDNLKTSRILLAYIDANWNELKLPKTSFKDTCRSFCSTNQEAALKSSALTSNPEFSKVKTLCESINERLSNPSSQPTRKSSIFLQILILTSAILVAFILYDVRIHDGVWVKSETYIFLQKNGFVEMFWNVCGKTQYYYNVSSKWLTVNGKKSWKSTSKFMKPYIKQFNVMFNSFWTWLLTSLSPMFKYITTIWNNTVYPFLKNLFVQILDFIDQIIQAIIPFFKGCVDRVYIMYQWIFKAFMGEVSWGELINETLLFLTTWYNETIIQLQILFKNIAESVAPVDQ